MATSNRSATRAKGASPFPSASRHRCARQDNRPIRVLLVEDLGLVRGALAALLADAPDIEVIGQLEGGAGVVRAAAAQLPDVIVVDVDVSSPQGVATIDQLRERLPESRVLALAAAARPGAARAALDAGVLGVLDKDAEPERLRDSIRQVAVGTRCIDPELAVASLCMAANPLTARELSVLRLAAGGASVLEIAESLSLSSGTVRNYLSRAVAKTGGRSRIDAIRIAREASWL